MISDFNYTVLATRHVPRCNLCGESGSPITIPERFCHEAGTLACQTCGLIWLSPQMSADSYSRFYADGTYRRLVRERVPAYTAEGMEKGQLAYANFLRVFLTPFANCLKGKSLIDIGGSTGIVARHIADAFQMRQPTVLEISRAEGAQAEERGCLWINDTLECICEHERKWDVVLLCQTVEHLMDISAGLETIASLLTPRGVLIIDIVDVDVDWRRHKAQVKIDHLWYLIPHTMRAYLMRAGFASIHEGRLGNDRHMAFLCDKQGRYGFVPDRRIVGTFLKLAGVT